MATQYSFGDTDLAAHRLGVLAEVYADSTRTFLRRAAEGTALLALDMGCGPGYTTHLLADTLRGERTVGLDNSTHFISIAQKTETEKVSFHVHDVTSIPFPEEPADLIFCRFLMTHLQDPLGVISSWATQLVPQGLLLLEEVEWIHTHNEVFALYLNIVDAMLERRNTELYVGRTLDRFKSSELLKRRASEVMRLRVTTRRAAAMFYLNIQTWKYQPFIKQNYPAAVIEELQRDLEKLAGKSGDEISIEWGLRQIVFERR
jgi:SAM-dependent methyltransferase